VVVTSSLPGWVSVAEAATQLDVEPEQVRDLAHAGVLDSIKVPGGQSLLIGVDSIARRRAAQPRPGRPLSAANAWAMLWLADHRRPQWASAKELTRVRHYLARPLSRWPGLLSRRAAVHRARVPDAVVKRVESLPGVCRGGVAAAIGHGAPLVDVLGGAAPFPWRELYLAPVAMAAVHRMRGVGWDSSAPNVLLRALPADVPSAVIEWVTCEAEVPAAVAAADLLEQGEQRARHAAAELLGRKV
jgi:hypothetical protein